MLLESGITVALVERPHPHDAKHMAPASSNMHSRTHHTEPLAAVVKKTSSSNNDNDSKGGRNSDHDNNDDSNSDGCENSDSEDAVRTSTVVARMTTTTARMTMAAARTTTATARMTMPRVSMRTTMPKSMMVVGELRLFPLSLPLCPSLILAI
jgi:hypothetical protein